MQKQPRWTARGISPALSRLHYILGVKGSTVPYFLKITLKIDIIVKSLRFRCLDSLGWLGWVGFIFFGGGMSVTKQCFYAFLFLEVLEKKIFAVSNLRMRIRLWNISHQRGLGVCGANALTMGSNQSKFSWWYYFSCCSSPKLPLTYANSFPPFFPLMIHPTIYSIILGRGKWWMLLSARFFGARWITPRSCTESQSPVSSIIDDGFPVRGGDWDTLMLNRGRKGSELTQQLCLLSRLLIRINWSLPNVLRHHREEEKKISICSKGINVIPEVS